MNPKRHTSCQVPSDPRAFDIQLHSMTGRPNSRTSLPANFGKSPMMGQRQLNPGEQRYFTSISRVYSNNQMIRLKRRQYIDLLNQQLSKGKFNIIFLYNISNGMLVLFTRHIQYYETSECLT